jgi:hypothetical protein
MRTFVPEALTLSAVLALSLIGPWDATDSNYASTYSPARYFAVGLLCTMAFYAGRHHGWAESISVAGGICFVGVVLFVGGSWVSREIGWNTAAGCDEVGGCYSGLSSTVVDSIAYALPFAGIGAILGAIGHPLMAAHWRESDA